MIILLLPVMHCTGGHMGSLYPGRAEEQAMDSDRAESTLAKSIEELIFGSRATRKNRLDIQRVVTAIVDVVRAEIMTSKPAASK